MCGIFVYYSPKNLDTDKFLRARESMAAIDHRGPDGQGIMLLNTDTGEHLFVRDEFTPGYCRSEDILNINLSNYNCVMGHKRLSIFDLSENGFQPMAKEGDAIVFNGEIYNWLEIRKDLEKKGYNFNTHSDTEVIIKAYREYGPEILQVFNGMWALVLWDSRNKKFFMARDRYGVKPILTKQYDDGSWIISSEEKGIVKFERKNPEIELRNLSIFVNEGHVAFDSTTFYKGINQFKPSHYVFSEPESVLHQDNHKNYYNITLNSTQYTIKNEGEAVDQFNTIFRDAVSLRLRADVAAGFSLSGGLDSSRIVYEVVSVDNYEFKPDFFSAIFPGSEVNEENSIRLIAKDLNIEPNFCYPSSEFSLDDFAKLTYVLDSPVPNLSYYAQWSVSSLVAKHKKKILVVGQGADEVFAGYHHHFYRYVVSKLLKGKISQASRLMRDYAEVKGKDEQEVKTMVAQQLLQSIKSNVKQWFSLKEPGLSAEWNSLVDLEKMLLSDLRVYQMPFFLKSDDRIGMWHGFESRYPFLDYRLVDFGFKCSPDLKIKDGWQKWIIRKSFQNGPEDIVWRKDKIGYRMPAHSFFENPDLINEAKTFLSKFIPIDTADNYRAVAAYLWMQQYK